MTPPPLGVLRGDRQWSKFPSVTAVQTQSLQWSVSQCTSEELQAELGPVIVIYSKLNPISSSREGTEPIFSS